MLNNITDWLQQHATLFYWIGLLSLLMFVLSLLLLPWLVKKIPETYFSRGHQGLNNWFTPKNIIRNLIGLIVLLAGIAMLVLPGQGLLTILVGIILMHFPGKYELERWIISRKGVLDALNWLRAKSGSPPLKI